MKKILHICLSGIYTDGFSYQENLLTKYHQKLGYNVGMLTGEYCYINNNVIGRSNKNEYIDENGVKIFRIPLKKCAIYKYLRRYNGTFNIIKSFSPDIIFIHGCQFLDVDEVLKYLKMHNEVKIYVDNHADFSNSAKTFLSKNILHRFIWKLCAKRLLPYTTKYYGVLPSRCDFLNKMYKIPKEKIELLVMGADDEYISNPNLKIRYELGIGKDDFLICFGGKIDSYKTEVLDLMNIVVTDKFKKKVYLIIFGSVDEHMVNEFNYLIKLSTSIKYIGWIDSKKSYDYFAISDLVCFPGRHSVFWKQVVAQGIPMLCKYWNGTTHVDIGNNVIFDDLSNITILKKCLHEIIDNSDIYEKMIKGAQSSKREKFLYSQIAKESIEIK